MAKSFFIDVTLCTACRGCQVACKQWHDLPAEETKNLGSYQNPPDLSFDTYKLVRMSEEVIEGKLKWLFFPEQCRHCIEAPCLETANDPDAIYKDEATGAILYTGKTSELEAAEIIESCPYNVPRKGPGGALAKCDMCNDRVHNGLEPACVKTCPTGAMNFGERDAMLALANQRLAIVKKACPEAALLDADDVAVIYLTAYKPALYHDDAVASLGSPKHHHAGSRGVTRQMALRRMLRPMTGLVSRLG